MMFGGKLTEDRTRTAANADERFLEAIVRLFVENLS